MSFLIPCPNCGPRPVEEFRCTGEVTVRPKESPTLRQLAGYIYFRDNVAGTHREWWYHRHGCGLWFVAERDTRTNTVVSTELPKPPEAAAPAEPLAVPDASEV
jgi:sarcosine oxidase subunit delta